MGVRRRTPPARIERRCGYALDNWIRNAYYNIIIDRINVMEKVTLSPKYQVVIPKKIRKTMRLRPGQKIHVLNYGDRIEMIPEKKLSEMRGFLRGMNTEFDRDEDRH